MAEANDFMLKADRELLAARFEKRCLAWEKARRHGKAIYVLSEVFTFAVFPLGAVLGFELWINQSVFHHNLVKALEIYAIVSLLAAVKAIWRWHRNEKRYRMS
jgi:hypothetical protein